MIALPFCLVIVNYFDDYSTFFLEILKKSEDLNAFRFIQGHTPSECGLCEADKVMPESKPRENKVVSVGPAMTTDDIAEYAANSFMCIALMGCAVTIIYCYFY